MDEAIAGDDHIVDDSDHHRLVVRREGVEAELVYRREGGDFIIVHTGVPESMTSHGVGGRLVAAALKVADDEGRTVVPWCPFARRWLRAHPEAAPASIDWASRPPR
ncbi:MAG TPA: GNAT family N-acetyltransferase [Acidimicrobiales bacterium]|nr:GNAT family N-acetyltransferase [Acidimicrobiales bacterium]